MKRKKQMSIPIGILFGIAVSLVTALAGAAVLAWLIESEKLGSGAIGSGAVLILGLASLLGCMTAAAQIKTKRLIVCGLTVAGFVLILLSMTALFFDGAFEGIGTGAAVIAAGGAIASIPGLKGKKSGGKRRKIGAYR